MSTAALQQNSSDSGRYHWTVKMFYRAIDAGVWDEPNRLELVNGELRERDVNPPHGLLTEQIYGLIRGLFSTSFWVRQEKPFRISFDGEPMPDIALVANSARAFSTRHPEPREMRLIIEVSDSTLSYDLNEKARLYAQAGIADYWVAAIPRRQVIVFRSPSTGGYRTEVALSEDDTISPLVASTLQIAVRDLLPPLATATQEI